MKMKIYFNSSAWMTDKQSVDTDWESGNGSYLHYLLTVQFLNQGIFFSE